MDASQIVEHPKRGALSLWAVGAWLAICGPPLCLMVTPLSGAFETLKAWAWLTTPLIVGGAALTCLLGPFVSRRAGMVPRSVAASTAVLAILGASLFLGYVHWLSYRLPEGSGVTPGQMAPEFSATSPDGATFTLSEHRGKRIALIFYRGMW